jgi:uncharacterized protein (DUF2236 family)
VDEGLFEESAVIRRVAGEGLILAGAGRALLLQLAHPAVARGVAAHSDFSDRFVDRLRATLTYVYAVLFGSREEAQAVSRTVRAVHTGVNGPGYDATDPALQVWVNATLVDTGLLLYQAVFGPLPPGEVEQCCRQHRVLATAIGCPADAWPRTFADFSVYWHDMVGSLTVTETARELATALLWPRIPWPARPVLPVARFLTVGLLPEPIRAGYGYSWTPRQARRLERGRRLTCAVYPRLPIRLRQAAKDHYLRDLRRRRSSGPGGATFT